VVVLNDPLDGFAAEILRGFANDGRGFRGRIGGRGKSSLNGDDGADTMGRRWP
jgi:hypothetical protein